MNDTLREYLRDKEDKLRQEHIRKRELEDMQFRNEPVPTTERGKLWKEYNELFIQLRREDEDNHIESAHRTQDEIYRKFVTDTVEGRFRNQEDICAMALLMKLNVVDFDKPNHWWYA